MPRAPCCEAERFKVVSQGQEQEQEQEQENVRALQGISDGFSAPDAVHEALA